MRKLAVYVHGKGGNATESEHFINGTLWFI